MALPEQCVECLYQQQLNITDHPEFLKEVRRMLDDRPEGASAPYMVYLFSDLYEKYLGSPPSFAAWKKEYNDLALSLEADVTKRVEAAEDPIWQALLAARVGNYIDFAVMSEVDKDTFLQLFEAPAYREADRITYESFLKKCETASHFLLLADNCGEIVFDKCLLIQLKKRFPQMQLSVMVRGGEALNDVTEADARYVGIDQVAQIISNGPAVAGTVYELLPPDAKRCVDEADVILSKGQGNYETFANHGFCAFYLFLCKCDLFTELFDVPKLTGMFIEQS